MVFESLVVDLLNRFIGDYVENLDRSQLKIGIWGGDVVLKNLEVKQSALDDLDLPVKIVYGHLGNLTLKIPWKNLYSAPVIADIDGLYVVVIPNSGVKYDEEKEEKAIQESKQKALRNIEEAKEREKEKDQPKDKKKDSFAEKMAMQVVKNLQVKVSNIHVRFEDTFTNASRPFGFGVTLDELSFVTTDENWKPCILGEAVKIIHKLISLESLSVYWNSDVQIYSKMTNEDCKNALIKNIASKDVIPKDVSYILGPITSKAQLKLNPKPENDESNFSIPKIFLNVVMQELAIAIGKYQYQDILELLQSLERMNAASKYRKYRPDVPRANHSKEWWKFGYNCILEEQVRRRKNNWSWERMKFHRDTCRKYKLAYKVKLTNKKLSKSDKEILDHCEKTMDVFNITIQRKQAEMEVEREGIKAKEEKSKQGWFGGWLGGNKKSKNDGAGSEITKQFQEAMTAEEKAKLFSAIDYQENASPAIYPKEFIENKLCFMLNNLTVSIKDETLSDPMILKLQLQEVYSCIEQRPSDDAVNILAKIDNMEILGRPETDGNTPRMITSLKASSDLTSLLNIRVETNPLDRSCDQRVKVVANPLQIVYDAATINMLIEVFKPPESLALAQLQAAAMNKFQDLKNMSATGLQHAIEQHKYLDLKIDLKSSFVIVPEYGSFKRNGHLLILDLGDVGIFSVKRPSDSSNIKQLLRSGSTESEVMSSLKSQAYDKFQLKISNVQILLSAPDEDWKDSRTKFDSDLHLLRPTDLSLELNKCIIPDTPNLPKMKVIGSLPNIRIDISDKKLMQLAQLGLSIPTPQAESIENTDSNPLLAGSLPVGNDGNILQKLDMLSEESSKVKSEEQLVQMTDLELDFEIKQICVCVSSESEGKRSPFINLEVRNLGTSVMMKTYEMKVDLYLGGISLRHMQFADLENETLHLIRSGTTGDSDHLFSINFIQVNKENPDLMKKYESTLQHLNVDFNELDVELHQDAILSLMKFANELSSQLQSLQGQKAVVEIKPIIESSNIEQSKLKPLVSKVSKKGTKLPDDEIKDLKLKANLNVIRVAISSLEKTISNVLVKGIDASVMLSKSKTIVKASLQDVLVKDPTPNALYSEILSGTGQQMVNANIVLYSDAVNNDTIGNIDAVDMQVSIMLGGCKVVFINRFVVDLLAFLDNFQAAKDKVSVAGVAAAEAAKQSMESAYQNASRMLLDISVQAPIIYVPQSSSSLNAIVANLGILTLKNSLELVGKTNKFGIPAIMDKMSLSLSDLKLSRVVHHEDVKSIASECLLLDPISLDVSIIRNMSIGWFKDVPEISADVKLSPIILRLTQEDFTVIMKLLNENLGEGQQPEAYTSDQVNLEVNNKLAESPYNDGLADEKLEKSEKAYKKVKFSFKIDKIGIVLYDGSSNLSEGLVERDAKKALASFELHMLILKGELMSNNSLWTNVILVNVIMDDLRSKRTKGITRYMECQEQQSSSTNKSMVDVTFSIDESGDKYVEMKVRSFTLIVCLEYLLAVADFFTKGMVDLEKPAIKSSSVEAQKKNAATETTVRPTSRTTVIFTLEKPEILLIENVEDIDSNAIILNTGLSMKLRITPDTQNISISIADLIMYLCIYNPEKRQESVYEILNPLSISFNFGAPFGKKQKIDLSFTDVCLHLSPGTISVLSAISSSISSSTPAEDNNGKKNEENELINIWNKRDMEACNFWFLQKQVTSGENVITANEAVELNETSEENDQLIVTMETILITIEANLGARTVPMLLMEANLHAEILNWTSNLFVSSTLAVEMSYYNEKIAVWEPLLEPVEDGKFGRKPWELCLEVTKNDKAVSLLCDEIDEVDVPSLPQPAMEVNIFSLDTMEICVSKVCLEVLTNLGSAFGAAVQSTKSFKEKAVAPFVVKNDSGLPITLHLQDKFQVLKEGTGEIREVILEANTSVSLGSYEEDKKFLGSILKNQNLEDNKILQVDMNHNGEKVEKQIMLNRDSQLFLLPYVGASGDKWSLVADLDISKGCKAITLRSHVQIHNHFSVPIEVYYMMSHGNEVQCCGTVKENSIFNVPIQALFTKSSELFFRPKDGYSVALEAFVWKDLAADPKKHMVLHCNSRNPEGQPFHLNVSGEISQVLYENTSKKTMSSTCYKINLRPTTIIRNLLPYKLTYIVQGSADEVNLEQGKSAEILSVQVDQTGAEFKISGYMNKDWYCRKTFDSCANELSAWTFESDTQQESLDLGVHTINDNGSLNISLYCPFWMVNKTGQALTYKQEDDVSNAIFHEPDRDLPILFSFKPKNFFSKKKACLKIMDSEWSDKFAIDVVGSSGKIVAKSKDGSVYEIGVQIKLSNFSLTKIVIFTPFNLIANHAPYNIDCLENHPGCEWISVPSNSCVPFWPKSKSKGSEMVAKISGSLEQTPVFDYVASDSTLLALDNAYCGLNVESQITESQVSISLSEYQPGNAPVLLVNATESSLLEFNQKGESYSHKLEPGKTILYTWLNPLSKRDFMWKCEGMKKQNSDELIKDGIGEFKDPEGKTIYWVSFLDGLQRVLLLTADLAVATSAQQAGELERADMEISLSLNGVGLSLVNNDNKKEILYIGIASSGVIWEGRKVKARRFKALTLKENGTIEQAYIKYQNDVQLGKTTGGRRLLDHKIEVDFTEMIMYKPNKRHIRRSFQNGIWLQYKVSAHRIQLHAKINRLQIDNQLPDCVFPVVLAPTPPPKSVAADSVPKPFTEVSMVMRKAEHSTVQQFKYFKVLIQEFHIKMDQGLIESLIEMFSPSEAAEIDHEELYKADLKIVETDLKTLAAIQSSHVQKNFYDELHFSPLKIHISFSMTGNSSSSSTNKHSMESNFVNLLLKSVGVTVTEIQDVVFKLAFFERKYKFISQQKLIGEAMMHYTGQAIKQMYVLVLGLDVIGNPFGLVLGLTQGVEDLFYEPIQGAIQGPEEFAEGLALGVKSLFGHALGGAAGAASRITGTLGKGIAALTMDDDYQKKRREAMNRQPANVKTGLAQSGKGLFMGVIDGVTGIVTKPIEGAKEEGVEGFFKGVGKGLIGVVARPTSGAIDFASGSLDAIKKVTEAGNETKRLRPPRFIQVDGIIRPFIRYEAEGNKLLLEIEKGKFTATDSYVGHLSLTLDGKYVLVVTDKRVIMVNKGEIFGQWDCEWCYAWNELKEPPSITEKGIKFLLKKDQKKKKLGFFSSSNDNGKIVSVKDQKSAAKIVIKMNEAMKKAF